LDKENQQNKHSDLPKTFVEENTHDNETEGQQKQVNSTPALWGLVLNGFQLPTFCRKVEVAFKKLKFE
jgi:hypothetical protein